MLELSGPDTQKHTRGDEAVSPAHRDERDAPQRPIQAPNDRAHRTRRQPPAGTPNVPSRANSPHHATAPSTTAAAPTASPAPDGTRAPRATSNQTTHPQCATLPRAGPRMLAPDPPEAATFAPPPPDPFHRLGASRCTSSQLTANPWVGSRSRSTKVRWIAAAW